MNCPDCMSDKIVIKDNIVFDAEECLKFPTVLDLGDLSQHCQYWFDLTEYGCSDCGNRFWLQDETK